MNALEVVGARSQTTGQPVALSLEVRAAIPRSIRWLSNGERERLSQMRFPRRRHDFRAGRWTAKRALARAFGFAETAAALADLEIRPDDRGAPHAFHRGERLPCDLSLSHRAGAVLCAIGGAGSQVGCDIEWVEPRSREFAQHFLNDEERERLAGLSPERRAETANLLWSAKESALKGLGTGLDLDVRGALIRQDPAAGHRLQIHVPGVAAPLHAHWGRHQGWIWTVASRADFSANWH